MILRQTINGRQATIAFFDINLNPIDDLSRPHMAKVLFDDGEMVILSSKGDRATRAVTRTPADEEYDEGEHDGVAFARHRSRYAPKTIKVHGRTLASWAKGINDQDIQRIYTAISVGISAGEDNTDIAHRVIGSRRNNGVEGMTEITRQHILRLGKGYLERRKRRMRGTRPDVRSGNK